MDIIRDIIMGISIRELFFGGSKDQKYPGPELDTQAEVNKEPKITFESDKELLERKRGVKIGDDFIGYIIKSDGVWGWLQVKEASNYKIEILSTETLIAITEKLKELNCCSDTQAEIERLEARLMQLEMRNMPYQMIEREKIASITNEICEIRSRLSMLRGLSSMYKDFDHEKAYNQVNK